MLCWSTAAYGQESRSEEIRAEWEKSVVLLWWGECNQCVWLLHHCKHKIKRTSDLFIWFFKSRFNNTHVCVCIHVYVGWGAFMSLSLFRPFVDSQPVYDVRGLPSCQGVHCGQDGACSGQDLWLLRTRCASDEYFNPLKPELWNNRHKIQIIWNWTVYWTFWQ